MTDPAKQPGNPPTILQSGFILAAVAAICTTLVALTFHITKSRIAANELAFLEQSLAPVLSGVSFDNDIAAMAITVQAPHVLPGTDDAVIYPLLDGQTPVGALFIVTAEDGFSGPIKLLIGIDIDGVVTGIRALEHQETPGIGDMIEVRKSDWMHMFDGTSLESPERDQWAIRRDGGVFDQATGASVTSRAVVNALAQTLRYFEIDRDRIFAGATAAGATDD